MPDGMLRHWIDPQSVEIPDEFRAAIGGRLATEILYRRNIRDLDTAKAFLNPDLYQPAPPESLPGITLACERIMSAIQKGEQICVWGDFDVDGQTSTTLLVSALRGLLGSDQEHLIRYHIPVRARESHGVNWDYLKPIIQDGASLIITCDTGISSHEALANARQMGVDVILTDHHDLPDQLPEAFSITNPKLLETCHSLSGLPGVGVAFMLAKALYNQAGRASEVDSFMDLAALGIVADLAIQTKDTRWLLQRGLQVLRQARRTGLAMLMELSGIEPAHLTEEHIGFVIGPRLNALGRLDDANPAVELLTTRDEARARILSTHLEGLNARRRLLTEQVLKGALSQIEKDHSLLEQAALVLSHPEWPAGVIGIVASELAERYNRPTILISAPPGQPARGSARSIESVHITEAIGAQKKLLHGFGGHPMAAGLSLDPEKIPAFRRGLSGFIEKKLGGTAPRPSLLLDSWVTLSDMTVDLVSDLERLAPFGPGNPPLVLAVPRLTILNSTTIGRDGDHVQVIVSDEKDRSRRVIWWRGAGWSLPDGVFDLACVVRSSNYRGQSEIQVEWIDARPVEQDEIHLTSPISVIDQRDLDHPLPILQQILAETHALVWGEADARDRIHAFDRTQLAQADTLVIWTTPPGPEELKVVMTRVQPKSIVVFAIEPQDATLEGFLKRLAGLCKYVLDKKSGKTELIWMAAATAQREASIRLGLKWLEQRGMIRSIFQPEGHIYLQPGSGIVQPPDDNDLTNQLKILLTETSAFRQYFKTSAKENLL